MTSIRKKFRFMLYIAVSAMLLMQSVAAGHDQFHHHVSDDCVICKIAEVKSDKASPAPTTIIVQPQSSGFVIETTPIQIASNLWTNALSRAPPAS